MGEASSDPSSKETRPALEEGREVGACASIFSLEPVLLAAVSLSCPAFPLQPSLPAPLLNLGILVCSSVNSLSYWIIVYLPWLPYPFLSGLILTLTTISDPAYLRPNMIFNLSKFSPFDC